MRGRGLQVGAGARRGLAGLVILSWAALATPGSASTSGLPALLQPASQERHVGKMIFAELVTPSIADAERFYGGSFGWTFRDVPVRRTRYVEALLNGQQVAAMIQRPLPADRTRRPSWLTFLSSRDVDAATRLGVHYGATVLFAPRDVPDLGREAVLADPQGAVFAVLASSSGDPGDYLADLGTWIWSSLITKDPGTAASFYNLMFGYQIYDAANSTSGRHLILSSDDYARASVNPFPANRPDYRPRWINYLRVDDLGAALGKVTSLGGRVLVPAHDDRDDHPVAIVADPQGAVFGMLQWTGNQPEEDAK